MRWGLVLLQVQLLCAGCAEDAKPMISDPPAEPIAVVPNLVGVWTTRGVDETLGEVEVEMTLEAEGRLSMVLLLASGGRRSFPGSWEIAADELVLRGAYFVPDGESRVRWRLEGMQLVLEDASGQQQQWQRKE